MPDRLNKPREQADLGRIRQIALSQGIDIDNLTEEQRQAHIQRLEGMVRQQGGGIGGGIQRGLETAGDIFLQRAGITPPTRAKPADDFVGKELAKQQIKQLFEKKPPTFEQLPPGYEKTYSKKGEEQITPIKVKPYKERYNDALKEAIAGTRTWEEVKNEFPQEREKIEQEELEQKPITKAPGFQFGRGIPALTEPTIAAPTTNATYFLRQIKTEADLEEFLDEAPKKIGKVIGGTGKTFDQNDINTVLEYFGRR